MSKKISVYILFTVVVLLGFLRDYLFYNINWVYKTLTENRPLQAREEFHFLLEFNPQEIIFLKWILTFKFLIVFGILTWLVIKRAFNNPLYSKITLFLFVGIIGVSGVLFVVYKMTGSPSSMYAVIRSLIGLGQSFVPLILLFITFKFFPKSSKIE